MKNILVIKTECQSNPQRAEKHTLNFNKETYQPTADRTPQRIQFAIFLYPQILLMVARGNYHSRPWAGAEIQATSSTI